MATICAETVAVRANVRWMIRRDLARVVAIEAASSGAPWGEADFVAALKQRNCIAMVAEVGEEVVGFMVYELHPGEIRLVKAAVDPDRRRLGIGRRLMDRLAGKLGNGRRRCLSASVRETDLAAQLFLRACGWQAVDILRGACDDTGEDAYRMVKL